MQRILDVIKFWHPKVALRYLPIVDEINRNYKNGDSILEVGSGSIGIAPYINQDVIGVDKNFVGKSHPKLKQAISDAANLPFADKSFDYVVSADVLEHILPENRKTAVSEWLRVTKKELILAFPEGKEAEAQDEKLYAEFKKRGSVDPSEKFIKEHIENKLPRQEEVISQINKYLETNSLNADIKIIDNLNLNFRWFLMKGWVTKNFFIDLFFRKILLLFIPLMRLFNQKPVYRKIVMVKFL